MDFGLFIEINRLGDGYGGLLGDAMGERVSAPLTVGFDRRVKLQFHGAKLSSDGGLLLYRELDEALGLSKMTSWELRDTRTGKNSCHGILAMFRQSLFGRVAGYEDVNDAGRLSRVPVLPVGGTLNGL